MLEEIKSYNIKILRESKMQLEIKIENFTCIHKFNVVKKGKFYWLRLEKSIES